MPSLNELYPNYGDYIKSIHNRFKKLGEDIALKHNKDTIIPLISKRLGERGTNELFKIKECLDDIFPNRYDIQVDFIPMFGETVTNYGITSQVYPTFKKLLVGAISIIIHYPELTITNTHDQSITIKDLFVKIPMNNIPTREPQSYHISKIQGTRTTVSRDEYKAKYFHSHLPRFTSGATTHNVGSFVDFCTGTDTDININLSLLNTETSLDVNIFKLYLMQIDTMVKWESIEGVPHIYMKEVSGKNYELPSYELSTLDNYYNNILDYLKRRLPDSIKLDFTFKDGKYVIVDNEKFEDWLTQFTGNIVTGYYKDDQGKYYEKQHTLSDRPINREYLEKYIVFNKEKHYFKVEETNAEAYIIQKSYVHPQIKNYVKSRLEYITNKEIARESIINRLTKGTYK